MNALANQLARSGADDMLAEPVQRPTAVAAAVAADALLTSFYVDNGPFLLVWNRLPHLAYWLRPTVVGAPAIRLAVHRFALKLSPHVE